MENIVTRYDFRWFENIIKDTTKLEKLARYLRDRYKCKKFSEQDMQSGKWLDQWSELYPSPTRTVVYQALIYVGEHAAARSLLPSHSQGEHTHSFYVCSVQLVNTSIDVSYTLLSRMKVSHKYYTPWQV